MGALARGLRAVEALLRLRLDGGRSEALARAALGDALGDALDDAVDAADDRAGVHALLALAASHRVVPLIAQALHAMDAGVGTGSWRVAAAREAFAVAARAVAADALHALPVLRSVMDTLAAARIEAMAWKGPALSVEAWGDPASRSFADLGVVVRPADRQRARAALQAAGWRGRHGMLDAQEDAIFAAQGAYELARGDASVFVELHWAFGARRYAGYPPAPDVIARAGTADLAGMRLRVPSRSDAIVLHAVHATKHGWSTLEDVALLARLAQDGAALHEARVTAARHGATRALALGEALVAGILDERSAPIAGESAPAGPAGGDPRTAGSVATLAAQVRDRWMRGQTTWRSTLRWDLAWVEGASGRLRLLLHSTFDPTLQEWRAVRLPPGLVGLYRVVRPVRLVARAFRGGRAGGRPPDVRR